MGKSWTTIRENSLSKCGANHTSTTVGGDRKEKDRSPKKTTSHQS